MVSVRLSWSPNFKVGQAHDLDSLETQIKFPALPPIGQRIAILAWELKEGAEPSEMGDHFNFSVKRIELYLNEPSKHPQIEALVMIQLDNIKTGEIETDHDYESMVCDVLLQVYKWKKLPY